MPGGDVKDMKMLDGLPADSTLLPIYNEDDKKAEEQDLNDTDPIFGSTFEMMIKEAFRADKHFVLAKMITRN